MSLILAYKYPLHQTDELEQLIQGCAHNERGAQNRLYELFYPKMMAMVLRYLPDHNVAEEVLNDSFLRVFQKIDFYRYEGSFEGWVRMIVTRNVIRYFHKEVRKKKVFPPVNMDADEYHDDGQYLLDQSTINHLNYRQLLQMVQDLPDMPRAVFNLFVIDGYNHKEISKALDLNPNTCRWYLSEAKRILKSQIEDKNTNKEDKI